MIPATIPRPLALTLATLLLAACAADPKPPTDAFQAAETAIANAEKDKAADYAPLEMRSAHEKLNAAKAHTKEPDEHSVLNSRRLADEARSDADLASAKARLAKADAVNLEMQKSSDSLRQETQRGSGN